MLQAKLRVIGGKHHNKVIPLNSKKFLIGREEDCHLRPTSELVSRHHCVFTVDDFTIRLRDLGSTNGTLVNGEKLRGQIQLRSGDHVRIGKLDLEVMIGDSQSGQQPAPKTEPLPEETAQLSGQETVSDMPISQLLGDLPEADSGDTEVFMAGQSKSGQDDTSNQAAPAPAPQEVPIESGDTPIPPPAQQPGPQQPQYSAPIPDMSMAGMYQQPPYGYPQMPYPQQPMAYPMYQQPSPYMMPPGMGYPQMPYPQQQMPQMPQMPMPQGGHAPEAPQQESSDSDSKSDMPALNLPDPSQTGAKEPEKKTGGAGGAEDQRGNAADIIKQYMQRRPNQ